MRGFFRSSRRNLGSLALVAALIFIAAWIRSQTALDEFVFRNGHSTQLLISARSQFQWANCTSDPDSGPPFPDRPSGWSTPAYVKKLRQWDLLNGGTIERRWQFCGLVFEKANIIDPDSADTSKSRILVSCWHISYWLIVIPLTLLSAYLLLSKPRTSKPLESTKRPDEAQVTHA